MNEEIEQGLAAPASRERPWPLAIFLTLSVLAVVYQMWQGVRLLVIGTASAKWLLIVPLLLYCAHLAAVFAMFGWKRWGVYLWYACAAVAGVLMSFAIPNLGSFFRVLVPAIILFFCVLPVWDEFE